MLLNTIILFIFILFCSFYIIRHYNKGESIINQSYNFWIWIVLMLGIIARVACLAYVPVGVMADEAISGYEAWCLGNFGVDSNLASWPVYFRSWGTGQSILYSYLSVPLVKVFGLSAVIYRLPMSIIGSLSILFFYYTISKIEKDKLKVLLIVVLFAFNPWHIMKSRCVLECNLFPDFLLIGVCFLILAYYTQRKYKQICLYLLGITFVALSAYGYAVAWMMLPFFVGILFLYLIKAKKISIPVTLLSIVYISIIIFPLILFIITLKTHGEQYQIGPMTITALKVSRHISTTWISAVGEQKLVLMLRYFNSGMRMLLSGSDGIPCNSIPFFGQFYNILAYPFIFIALKNSFRKEHLFTDTIFLIWLIASLPILLILEPNVNHWNTIWFPLTYFCAKGVYIFVKNNKPRKIITGVTISLLFISFSITYVCHCYTNIFFGGEKSIQFVNTLNMQKIYYSEDIIHVFPLFYSPISPYKYNENRVIKIRQYETIDHMKSYGKNTFQLPDSIINTPGVAYVISNDSLPNLNIDFSKFDIKKEKYYTVLYN